MNVIQAMFLTPTPIDLWPYEETNVLSESRDADLAGTVREIIPNIKSELGLTNYTSTMLRGGGQLGQHIAMKNHVLKYSGLNQDAYATDRLLEVGARTCEYVGVFSVREDLILRDLGEFMQFPHAEWSNYNQPTIPEFLENASSSGEFSLLPAYGQAPPILLYPREDVKQRYGTSWKVRGTLSAFRKPRVENEAA